MEEDDEAGAAQLRAEPAQRQENRTGLPDGLKAGIESLSGMDMSEVRVHRNSSQPAQLNALAYAQGNDIHLGPGQEQHLPHEAWHVVQQWQGRVQATMQMAGVGVNDDLALEEEADVMGEQAEGASLQLRKAVSPQELTSESQAAARRTLIDGIPRESRQPTAQLKHLPRDSVGSLEKMPVKGEKDITAKDLQKRLITELKKVGEVDRPLPLL
ncbi:DUF4157 domain-containing protein [Roseateles asaccharophilus]